MSDFNGYISGVRLYNRVLTSQELEELVDGVNKIYPSGGEVLLWQNYLIAAGCKLISPSSVSISDRPPVSPGNQFISAIIINDWNITS